MAQEAGLPAEKPAVQTPPWKSALPT